MIESIVLAVTGMKCGGCETNVSGVLKAVDGVANVGASSKDNSVSIEFDNEKTSLAALKQAIAGAGFDVAQ